GLGGNLVVLPQGGDTRMLEDSTGQFAGTGGNFTSTMFALDVGAGFKGGWLTFLPEDQRGKTAMGGSLKIFNQNLDGNLSTMAGLDLGALYQVIPGETRAGLSVQNLGLLSLGGQMPLLLRAGVMESLWQGSTLLSGDFDTTLAGGGGFSAGGSYSYDLPDQSLEVLGGGSFPFSSPIFTLSLGFGYAFFTREIEYELHYAYIPYGDLGTN